MIDVMNVEARAAGATTDTAIPDPDQDRVQNRATPDSRDPTDDPDSECQRDDPPRGQRSVRAHSSERVAEQPQALHKQDDTGDHPERPRAGQQKHLEKCTDDDSWHGSGQELAGQGGP
jgi:hypothetical protein